jgi:hypothetical protein
MAPDDEQETGGEGADDDGDDSPEDLADPFDHLAEDVGDREGDPFETLAGEADGEGDGPGADETGGARDTDGKSDSTTAGDGPAFDDVPVGDPTTGEPTDPFADIPPGEGTRDDETRDAEDEPRSKMGPAQAGASDAGSGGGGNVTQGGDRTGDPFASAESAFEEMDIGDLDPDQVWQELDDAEARGSVSEARERIYAEVSKHAYCEGCEWFAGPPEVSCSHEGTEILEFVDMETVRVVDCPIVEERRQLQEGE